MITSVFGDNVSEYQLFHQTPLSLSIRGSVLPKFYCPSCILNKAGTRVSPETSLVIDYHSTRSTFKFKIFSTISSKSSISPIDCASLVATVVSDCRTTPPRLIPSSQTPGQNPESTCPNPEILERVKISNRNLK